LWPKRWRRKSGQEQPGEAVAEPQSAEVAEIAEDAPSAPPPEQPDAAPSAGDAGNGKREGWLSRMRKGLSRSSGKLGDGIGAIFTKRKLDDAALEELEELLISADLGVSTAAKVTAGLAKERFDKEVDPQEVRAALAEQLAERLEPVAKPLDLDSSRKPHVVLVVGVNGSGKTTTIGKLAKQWTDAGRKVHLAAGDTFRAAAVEQLQIWGQRTGAPVTARDTGADAAGLAYDALQQARREGADVLLVDTAGRLHNKANLMAELQKIVRVLKKLDDSAPHDVLLVLDATIGQNAVQQVQTFKELVNVTGLVVTKLDGSARGGVLVALADRFGLPVHAIGVGEAAEDMRPFSGRAFARALVGLDPEG
jgi:fused signal recognition particle receptor